MVFEIVCTRLFTGKLWMGVCMSSDITSARVYDAKFFTYTSRISLTSARIIVPTSYFQKLVTVVSGGAFGWLFSVLEFDALNDCGDLVRAI